MPKNISAVFFPVLYINEEIQNLNENFFYNNWQEIKIKNELINFILPLEDLEDISNIKKMRDNINDLDILPLVNKYEEKNYVFVFMDFDGKKLNMHLKTNFNNNKTSKNISYNLEDISFRFIPSPHLVIKKADFKIKENENYSISKLENIKIFISIL